MTKTQWTVLGLVAILAVLEIVLHPTISGWLSNLVSFFKTANLMPGSTAENASQQQGILSLFGSIPQTIAPNGKNTQPGTISSVGTQCPPGYKFVPIAGGTTGTCVKIG